jgi:uncharacterized protein DUF4340
MVRGSTWILLVLLLGVIGLSLFLQGRKTSQPGTPTPTASSAPLFDVTLGEPSSIRVENAAGDAVALSRGPDGTWRLTAPSSTEADQAAAQAAATQVVALRVLSSVRLAPAVVGLDTPAYTLTFEFLGSEQAQRLFIGSTTPIQDGYYAQLNDGPLQVVDKFGLDALIGLLTAPPYLATLTPVASATPLASPTWTPLAPAESETAGTATVAP